MADAVGINRARIGVPDFDLRYKISQVFAGLVKFAVDSAVDGSRIFIPGKKQAHKTVPEGLMDIPLSPPLKAKNRPDLKVANDIQVQTKMKEVEEHVINLKQRYISSNKCVEGSEPPKKPLDGDLKEIDIPKNGRRIFIRSRL
ncbi:uncharacterized protein G2W53_011627 [Senna tora]|uniref:Uncharacterized protein n=1 Tax=Senna tora TaxID=362788 RepID=A0A834X1M3_9FABA|nr:uncharacterized protein G2W53_011627 [Senna tora]